MKLKTILGVVIAICVTGSLKAQESSLATLRIPVKVGTEYLKSAEDQAVLFSGKEQTAYDLHYTNHPYFLTSQCVLGDLWHNQVYYKDVPLRLDLFRDELITQMPGTPYYIVLEAEKIDQATISGYRIIRQVDELWPNIPKGNYLILLYDGSFPIVKKYQVILDQKIVDQQVEYSFRVRERYYVYKDNTCHPVSNKASLLKLFPDKKKELAAYIKQHKLKFKKEREQSIVAVVEYYDNLIH